MAIDKSGEFWYGTKIADIDSYLKDYSADNYAVETVKRVTCPQCGNNIWEAELDPEVEAVQMHCRKCDHDRFLMDSEEYWDECEPEALNCQACSGTVFNLAVGLARRDNGDVKWIYVGSRCTTCGQLNCPIDWKISYSPTDQLEASISPKRPGFWSKRLWFRKR